MAIKTTRWIPDTCGDKADPTDRCIVEFTWDDTLPVTSRAHTVSILVKTCSAHASAPFVPGQALEHANHGGHKENKRKNDVESEALGRLKNNATYTETDAGGTVVWKGRSFEWAYNTATPRVLVVTITPALTTAQRNQIQGAVDQRLGAGLVLIQ